MNGAVAQLGARINRTDEVRGSNPLSSIGEDAGRSSVVLPCVSRNGAVAQLGAHLNGIEEVKGSSPFSSTRKRIAYGWLVCIRVRAISDRRFT